MKDLDFDELDKAVNSLMGDVSKSTPAKKDDDAKTLDISPTLKEDAKPDFSKIEDNAAAAASPAIPTTSATPATRPAPAPAASSVHAPSRPPASRRGGRFMDVVHPSSAPKKPSAPVSRQGVTIQPSAQPTVTESPEPEQPAVPAIVEAPTVEKAKTVDTTGIPQPTPPASAPVENEWPDPLDAAGFKFDDAADSQPLTSPFLADAKVEKRPLGGAAPAVEEAVAPAPAEEPDRAPVLGVAADESATKDDPNDQLPAKPEIEAPLPEELQGDLVAIESGSRTSPVPAQPDEQLVQQQPTPAVSATPAAEPKEEVAPSGPTSIPQQYKEEKSTGEEASGAIYDTDTYHQPLAHPAQKKSGWMWVLWIVGILAVGTAGGAALFFLGVF